MSKRRRFSLELTIFTIKWLIKYQSGVPPSHREKGLRVRKGSPEEIVSEFSGNDRKDEDWLDVRCFPFAS